MLRLSNGIVLQLLVLVEAILSHAMIYLLRNYTQRARKKR